MLDTRSPTCTRAKIAVYFAPNTDERILSALDRHPDSVRKPCDLDQLGRPIRMDHAG
jgi:hypothetical protein